MLRSFRLPLANHFTSVSCDRLRAAAFEDDTLRHLR
jgi:hypothetical protein